MAALGHDLGSVVVRKRLRPGCRSTPPSCGPPTAAHPPEARGWRALGGRLRAARRPRIASAAGTPTGRRGDGLHPPLPDPVYERARVLLAQRGVDLEVYVGDPTGSRIAHSRDFATLPWFVPVPNRILRVLGKELWWQPVLGHVRGADLVVVEQASSRLVNYVLLGWQAVGDRGWCPGGTASTSDRGASRSWARR